jgi:dipeptidyl-peptidase-4
MKRLIALVSIILIISKGYCQPVSSSKWERMIQQIPVPEGQINIFSLKWLPGSHNFWIAENENIYQYNAEDMNNKKLILAADQIKAAGLTSRVEAIVWSKDQHQILIYTNSARVWRGNTRGDYWYFDLQTGKGHQIGKGLPGSSLMFAKFADDNQKMAYVSKHNLYVEDIASATITKLTSDGTDRIINGTFDWVYEEELSCRDGFRWSPDSKHIAFWRVDATLIKNHLMIDNTDSLYPFTIPVEYPKAGEKPSSVKIGVIDILTKEPVWLEIPGDPDNNYLPRMEWAGNSKEITVAQLNRQQNEASLYMCQAETGKAEKIYTDKDEAWIDIVQPFVWDAPSWTWIEEGKSFLWSSEKDGWLHIYKVSRKGKDEQLLTKGNFDAEYVAYDKAGGNIYFNGSPYDATQSYLYKVNLKKSDTVRVTAPVFEGTNFYVFSPDGKFAAHANGNIHRSFNTRLLSLDENKKIYPAGADEFTDPHLGYNLEKFKIKTVDNVEMDGIMAKPVNFDPSKKYPVYFYVYGEPAEATAVDLPNFDAFITQLIPEGYIGITMDNRGTPQFKGRAWRKSIYKKIGVVNSRDQAMAATEVLKWPFIDTARVAVHGWSGGGSMTLNLLFRYPEIYKTGIAIAAVTDQHFYDNIYTERYMGVPQENEADYEASSPVNFAKNLKGNLLYIHGTGDDNVHYKNAEVLINELIKNDKLFSLMIYPNRSHGINEGEGTQKQLNDTFVKYLREHCPPGTK